MFDSCLEHEDITSLIIPLVGESHKRKSAKLDLLFLPEFLSLLRPAYITLCVRAVLLVGALVQKASSGLTK